MANLNHFIGEFADDDTADAYMTTRSYPYSEGLLYENTTYNILKIWDGVHWEEISGGLYGEMYMYEATQAVTINTTDVYHAVYGFSQGALGGFTFNAGRNVDANISAESNPAGATLRITTSAAHGLSTGDIVSQSNMNDAGHDGVTAVTVVDVTNYDCDDIAYVAGAGASAGVVDEGSYLEAADDSEGTYIIHMSISGQAAGTNKVFKWEVNKNASAIDTVVGEREYTTTNIGNVASTGIVTVAAGDRLWLSGKNKTDATDFTIEHANINLHKL